MGSIAIPQVITPSKASGAQVIDGSLKFDKDKTQYLSKELLVLQGIEMFGLGVVGQREALLILRLLFLAHILRLIMLDMD